MMDLDKKRRTQNYLFDQYGENYTPEADDDYDDEDYGYR